MKVWKTMLAAALAAAALLGLTACGGGITNDATVYVQGLLDANYKGQISQEYIDVVEDMTQEQAEADHANNLEMEGDYLLTYLAVDMPTDAVIQRAQELVDEIYSHAQYTVADAEQLSGGDIVVEVTISPIEIMPQLTSEFLQETWDTVLSENGIATQEQLRQRSAGPAGEPDPPAHLWSGPGRHAPDEGGGRLLFPGGFRAAEAGRDHDRLLRRLRVICPTGVPAAPAAGTF